MDRTCCTVFSIVFQDRPGWFVFFRNISCFIDRLCVDVTFEVRSDLKSCFRTILCFFYRSCSFINRMIINPCNSTGIIMWCDLDLCNRIKEISKWSGFLRTLVSFYKINCNILNFRSCLINLIRLFSNFGNCTIAAIF